MSPLDHRYLDRPRRPEPEPLHFLNGLALVFHGGDVQAAVDHARRARYLSRLSSENPTKEK